MRKLSRDEICSFLRSVPFPPPRTIFLLRMKDMQGIFRRGKEFQPKVTQYARFLSNDRRIDALSVPWFVCKVAQELHGHQTTVSRILLEMTLSTLQFARKSN